MKTKLLDCFSHRNKRRLLNLLQFYPLTNKDAVKVLKLKKSLVSKYLTEFTEAGIVQRTQKRHKAVIFECISIPIKPMTLQEFILTYKIDADKYPLNKFIVASYQMRNLNDAYDFAGDFISEAFRIFKINDPQFEKDLKEYNSMLSQMDAPKEIEKLSKKTLPELRDFFNRIKRNQKLVYVDGLKRKIKRMKTLDDFFS